MESFIGWRSAKDVRTSSAVVDPWDQTKLMTSSSSPLRLFQVLRSITLHNVTLRGERVKWRRKKLSRPKKVLYDGQIPYRRLLDFEPFDFASEFSGFSATAKPNHD